jgi:hypothetical protein
MSSILVTTQLIKRENTNTFMINSNKIMNNEPDIPVAYALAVDAPVPSEAHPSNASVTLPISKAKNDMSERATRLLIDQGFSRGLAAALAINTIAFPLRIWVIDNSGSMASNDGSRLVETSKKNHMQYVQCTRWNELQETVKYHAEMAALLKAPTVFRLLNDPGAIHGPQQFSVAKRGDDQIQEDLQIAFKCMDSAPTGLTPLTQHVQEIRQNIVELQPELQRNGTKVAIVLATDGLPTSSDHRQSSSAELEFVQALKSLEGLPVWVVIRLCTDDESVVEFYNDLDSQLEYSLEVLDDFENEAKEIYKYNKFLNYALPLHRCREMGYNHRIFDFLDERELSKDELVDLFVLLFGQEQMAGVPSPHADWKGFCLAIKRIADKEEWHWNPMKRKVQPWVDVKKLHKAYGTKAGCSIM